jgi:hypothetical protein
MQLKKLSTLSINKRRENSNCDSSFLQSNSETYKEGIENISLFINSSFNEESKMYQTPRRK